MASKSEATIQLGRLQTTLDFSLLLGDGKSVNYFVLVGAGTGQKRSE